MISSPEAVVRRRVVLHFAGFEPLDAEAHRRRYARSAEQAASVWDCRLSVGPLAPASRCFEVAAEGDGWATQSRIHLFDLAEPIEAYQARPAAMRIVKGYTAAARVVLEGGLVRYLRHAWRFGLFFIFPFLLTGLALAATAAIAGLPAMLAISPFHLLWSIPAAAAFFRFAFLPFSERYHTLHLFSDWEMAVSLAREDAHVANLLKRFKDDVRTALQQPADEILITSHSIGSNLAVHVVGGMLEDDPDLFAGRRVHFVTLGGTVLQCAFLDSAVRLRQRVRLIAEVDNLFWLDVQCLTDVVNFYRSRTFALCGHPGLEPAAQLLIRFKHMLEPAHYKRIKGDMLRVHRQYVLGSDRRSPFDFTLMTSGPLPATAYAGFSAGNLPLSGSGTATAHEPATSAAAR